MKSINQPELANKIIFCSVLILFVTACNCGKKNEKQIKTSEFIEVMHGQQSAIKVKDALFIHLSHGYDDPLRAIMALNMAVKMSNDKEVLLFLDLSAINIILNNAENIEIENQPGLNILLDQLKNNKVPIMVCPLSLQAEGKTQNDLPGWVKLAEKKDFFNLSEGKILTLDY